MPIGGCGKDINLSSWLMAVTTRNTGWNKPAARVKEVINIHRIFEGEPLKVST
jgi:hypothetical protein